MELKEIVEARLEKVDASDRDSELVAYLYDIEDDDLVQQIENLTEERDELSDELSNANDSISEHERTIKKLEDYKNQIKKLSED